MRAEGKRLYRDCDSLLLGVCSGIADYFGVSHLFARIITIALVPITAGAIIPLYLLIAIFLPKSPYVCPDCVDIQPIELERLRQKERDESPRNPRGFTETGDASPPEVQQTPSNTAPGAAYFATYGIAQDSQTKRLSRNFSIYVISFIVTVALIAIFSLLGRLFPQITLFEFWPIFSAIYGVFLMIGTKSHPWSLKRFFAGLFVLLASCVAFLCVTGVVGWGIWYSIASYWPLVLIAVGLLLMARVQSVPGFDTVGVVLLLAMVAVGGCRYLMGQSAGVLSVAPDSLPRTQMAAEDARSSGPAQNTSKLLSVEGYDAATLTYTGAHSLTRLGAGIDNQVIMSSTEALLNRSDMSITCGNRQANVSVDSGSALGTVADSGTIYTGLAKNAHWKSISYTTSYSDDEIDLYGLWVDNVDITAANARVKLSLGDAKGMQTPHKVTIQADGSQVCLVIPMQMPVVVRSAEGVFLNAESLLSWEDSEEAWVNKAYYETQGKRAPIWTINLQGDGSKVSLEREQR